MKKYLKTDFELNKLIDVFDETPIWSAPFGLKLLDYIDYRKNISVLDIGFGTGFPLTEIALRLGETATVYGIDPWKEIFERVNKKINYYGISNIKLFEGVAESIPLQDDSIDLITSNNGINNVNNIEKVISECARLMKPDGQFIQTMNLDKSMFEFYDQMEIVLSEHKMKKEIELMHEHISEKRPSLQRVTSLIEKNGFVIKDLIHDEFDYKLADGSAMLNHYFIRMAFMDSWVKILPTAKLEQIFDMIETRLNSQSERSGGMKLSIPFVMINAIKQ